MKSLLQKIGDTRLEQISGCIDLGNTEKFKEIQASFPEYDSAFLWLLCYAREDMPSLQKYVEANYKKFHQVLDSRFPNKLSQNGSFSSHMWEMILCDMLSISGKLIPKGSSGADFMLETPNEDLIQIEAVAPDEADDKSLRSIRPDYTESNFFEVGGNIEDLERPILLRVLRGIQNKKDKYSKEAPLIIAINSHKVVGLASRDDYVLRRLLFGLGAATVTMDGRVGLQQLPLLNKPDRPSFPVAIFRDPAYEHISGIIYTSQNPLGLVPDGYGWHNYGITYVPNPLAHHKAEVQFPFLRKIECTEDIYREIDAEQVFKSLVV